MIVTFTGPDLPVNMYGQCLAKVGHKVYVIGGRKIPGDNGASYTRLDTVYIYDFSKFDQNGQVNGPETGPLLNLGREFFGCGTLESGAILVAGGEGKVGGRTNSYGACDNASVVKLLVERGADLNTRNKWGQTALLLAAGRRHREQFVYLLRAGARLDLMVTL